MKPIVAASRFAMTLTLVLGTSLLATMASAQEGQNLRTMQCAAAKALVNSKGAAILNSGPDVFNRYVKDAAFCLEDMYLQGAWVRTQDSKSCFVGYTCVDQRE
jgi:ABC-type sugar transport system substrate-binding protein